MISVSVSPVPVTPAPWDRDREPTTIPPIPAPSRALLVSCSIQSTEHIDRSHRRLSRIPPPGCPRKGRHGTNFNCRVASIPKSRPDVNLLRFRNQSFRQATRRIPCPGAPWRSATFPLAAHGPRWPSAANAASLFQAVASGTVWHGQAQGRLRCLLRGNLPAAADFVRGRRDSVA